MASRQSAGLPFAASAEVLAAVAAASERESIDVPELLSRALVEWLRQHGYLTTQPEEGMRPEQLSSENDD